MYFKSLKQEKTIHTWRECGELYYLNLDPKPVASSSHVYTFDQHCLLEYPSLRTLKLLLSELNYVTSLNC